MSDDRTERIAPPPPGYPNDVPVCHEEKLSGVAWVRLGNRVYPKPFYASLKSRLTPSSELFPCVYIAASLETAVAEIWGDRWTMAKKRGKEIFVITAEKADELVFLQAGALPKLDLCDLTDATTQLRLGIDAATLFTPDLRIPQAWAEMIASHPNRYDGIIYQSRHTGETCVVLWLRSKLSSGVWPEDGKKLDELVTFTPIGGFRESAAAYSVAHKIGIKLSWPSGKIHEPA